MDRERAARAYRMLPYYLSRLACDTPLRAGQGLLFSAVIYYAVGLNPRASAFFIFCALIVCIGEGGAGAGPSRRYAAAGSACRYMRHPLLPAQVETSRAPGTSPTCAQHPLRASPPLPHKPCMLPSSCNAGLAGQALGMAVSVGERRMKAPFWAAGLAHRQRGMMALFQARC